MLPLSWAQTWALASHLNWVNQLPSDLEYEAERKLSHKALVSDHRALSPSDRRGEGWLRSISLPSPQVAFPPLEMMCSCSILQETLKEKWLLCWELGMVLEAEKSVVKMEARINADG
ncbi:hypothetical protein V6N11_021555 [Hibiscus sabdariffa]|uniref:Uncharacterized protein n=1 Tax=Hibiscus sabdariffa TaxID=183260 RepID=A0ABR2NI85_9ROSI